MSLDPSFSTGLRNAILDGTDFTAMFNGASATLRIFENDASRPADADTAEGAASTLADVLLPTSDAFAASASSGSIAKAGTWECASASDTGTAQHFRIYALTTETGASTTFRRLDGNVGVGASFDLDINTTTISSGDNVVVDTFTVTIALT